MNKESKSKYMPALRFNWLTRYYDIVAGTTTRERTFKHALINQAHFESGQLILDLASGTGTLAIWMKLHEPKATVTGIDGDSNILSLAREKVKKRNVSVEFTRALSYDLSYPNSHYDRVVSSFFFIIYHGIKK